MIALASWLAAAPDTDKVAFIALCGVLFSAVVAFLSSRKAIYINSVTVERSKWIDAIRLNLAELSKESRTLNYKLNTINGFFKSSDHIIYIDHVNELTALIRLQLNPRGLFDKNVMVLLNIIPSAAQGVDSRDIVRLDDLLMSHSQWLLKAEWEKVKFEASGILRKCWIWCKLGIHSRRYRNFCKGEGRLL
jgi:hypothetical protein